MFPETPTSDERAAQRPTGIWLCSNSFVHDISWSRHTGSRVRRKVFSSMDHSPDTSVPPISAGTPFILLHIRAGGEGYGSGETFDLSMDRVYGTSVALRRCDILSSMLHRLESRRGPQGKLTAGAHLSTKSSQETLSCRTRMNMQRTMRRAGIYIQVRTSLGLLSLLIPNPLLPTGLYPFFPQPPSQPGRLPPIMPNNQSAQGDVISRLMTDEEMRRDAERSRRDQTDTQKHSDSMQGDFVC